MPPLTSSLKYSKGENWEGEKRWEMRETYFLVLLLVNGPGCALPGCWRGCWRYRSWGSEGPWQVPGSSSEGGEWLGGKRGATGALHPESQHPQRRVLQAQMCYTQSHAAVVEPLLVFCGLFFGVWGLFWFGLVGFFTFRMTIKLFFWLLGISGIIFFLIAQIIVKHPEGQHERAGPLPWCRCLQPSRFLKVLAQTAHQPLSSCKYSEVCAGRTYACRECVQKIFSS